MELALDDAPNIHVCTVLPASIDTPLFDQGANWTGRAVRPMPPIYSPEEVAAKIVELADRPRPVVFAGGAGLAGAFLHGVLHPFAPLALERQLAAKVDRDHFADAPAPTTTGNLFAPQGRHAELSGGWKDVPRSATPLKGVAAAVAGGLLAYAAWRWQRSRTSARRRVPR
jgi:hypothetical protein